MMGLNRNEPNEYHTVRDLNDYMFVNYTRPQKQDDMLNALMVGVSFCIQLCVPNDPAEVDYYTNNASILIRAMIVIFLYG